MRCILPLLVASIVVAGCGSSSSTPNDMQTASGPDLASPSASCSQTVNAYCGGANRCIRDTASAQLASSWCPDGGTSSGAVTLQHCAGGQTVIVATYVDSADHFVYVGGALVAVLTSPPHSSGNLLCVAGPATVAEPSGCDTPTTLCAGP